MTRPTAGHAGLADYYAAKGESPGRWFGAALGALDLEIGSQVAETHMRNLLGEGRHPDAERLENAALDEGKSVEQANTASQFGRFAPTTWATSPSSSGRPPSATSPTT
ncbi:relaxase domain-containing protein [Nocardioides sp. QY071]|uniref:relaxase domain-containing protein n=1 Tax=Nocardioides sp. QY071 TaxID=3044187 RepID=UPI002499B5D9|nr:relaxase domain-containing protein [Nocardioides sp. QY071]WGY00490.1 relaxase domain-containing protein [Nocardioides sp. QY071]